MALSDYQNTMGNYGNSLNQFNQNSLLQNEYARQLGNYRTETKAERIVRLKAEIKAQEALMLKNQMELADLTLNEPLLGPTQNMLNENEALRNAWEEFNVVWKLVGKK